MFNDTSSETFVGQVGMIRVWKQAFDGSQVQRLYNYPFEMFQGGIPIRRIAVAAAPTGFGALLANRRNRLVVF